MEFRLLKKAMYKNFQEFSKGVQHLLVANVDKDKLWEHYLSSFPEGTNPIFRERTEHDCTYCKQFIRRIGGVVKLVNGKLTTIWDFKVDDPNYQIVVDKMNEYVLRHEAVDVFVCYDEKVGISANRETTEDGTVLTWEHLHVDIPNQLIASRYRSIGDIENEYRSNKDVFYNSLKKITMGSIDTVLELIASNTLYKGKEWESQLQTFREYKKKFELAENENLFAWENSFEAGAVISRMKNHSIGVLLLDISANADLEVAVKKYENMVAGVNYKRPNPIYTKATLEKIQKKLVENGYEDSLYRRFANIHDIKVNNVLFANKDSAKVISNIFDEMKEDISVDPKKFNRVEEISINDFIENVLPNTTELEVLFENRLTGNLVSLTAPKVEGSKSMFKWENGFGWAYRGNITDSVMKERVKANGGDVTGVLRFSIQWNDLDTWNRDDLDAHCLEPYGNRIYFGKSKNVNTKGELDQDIRIPDKGVPATENITWKEIESMEKGTYTFLVDQYDNRGGMDGFCAEIEFNGEIHEFEYRKPIKNKEQVIVAEVDFDGENFTIRPKLPSTTTVRTEWGIKTNQFVPVSLVTYSPNYWDENVGHRHYMFMLKGCINNENPNGFYNEFFKQEFHEDRKVLQALGNKLKLEDTDDQLSGLGFSETKRNSVIVRTTGKTKRLMKVKF
jgi:hypothetical protein